MSLTNDQITAKNFKEFYKAIRPYLNGSFPTAIANKFDKANMYSTDEQIVGRWIDGKPIYQRVFHLPDETAANAKVTYNHGISDIENVVKCNGTANYMANGTIANPMAIPFLELDGANLSNSARATLTCDKTKIQFTAYNYSYPFHDIYAAIQYTKNTDTAMEIGSDTDYSETEKIVGTWIDGKPLYQKTITGTISTSSDYDVNHNVENIDTVVDVDGYLTQTGTGFVGCVPIGFFNGTNRFSAIATKTQLWIRQNGYNSCPFVITIQYTKTTD